MIFRREPIRVMNLDGITVQDGEVGYCADCGAREWYVFLMGARYVPHVQCCQCGEVYLCPGAATDDPSDLPQRFLGELEQSEEPSLDPQGPSETK
jgi:hypothetical protein